MSNLVFATVLGCCGLACSVCQACNCGASCNCGCPCGPAVVAPAAPVAAAPQAAASPGYRAYSYQPGPTTYRSFSPARARGGQDATSKALGRY